MARRFVVEIKTDNAAFKDDLVGEIARILREIAEQVDNGTPSASVLDVNGNRVGSYGFKR